VETKELEASTGETDPQKEERLRLLAQGGYNPVIAVGFAYSGSAAKVAKETVKEAVKGKKPKKRAEGQREMLLPISGKGGKEAAAKPAPKEAAKKADKPVRAPARAKKAG